MPSPNTGTASSGITTDALTGERHIPSSTRADGSQRREIRVRPGYTPPEDVAVYKNRTSEAWKNRGKGGIPGTEGMKEDTNSGISAAPSSASTKNAKKREAKRRAKAAQGTNVDERSDANREDGPTMEVKNGAILVRSGKAKPEDKDNWHFKPGVPDPQDDPEQEKERKARNLKKKLKQARELRDKKEKGENLLPEQFEKVIRINELIRQLDAMGFDSEGEKKIDAPNSTSNGAS